VGRGAVIYIAALMISTLILFGVYMTVYSVLVNHGLVKPFINEAVDSVLTFVIGVAMMGFAIALFIDYLDYLQEQIERRCGERHV